MNSNVTGEGADVVPKKALMKSFVKKKPMTSKKMSARQTKAGNQEHSVTLTRSHSLIHSLLTFVFMSMLKIRWL